MLRLTFLRICGVVKPMTYIRLLATCDRSYQTITQHLVTDPMNIKPMKPFFSQMFRQKTLDVITLFHKPSLPASTRVANLIKQMSAQASETATEDQASDHTAQNKAGAREPFETEITESTPTPDQLKNILEYVGGSKISELVKGATSQSDALRKLKENPDAFQRPVLVDWNQGKAIIGDKESEILKLLREQPKSS